MQNKVFVTFILIILVGIVGYRIYSISVEEEPSKKTTLEDVFKYSEDAAVTLKEEDNKKENILKSGIINTLVDGYDVKKVNLWSSPDENRRLLGLVYSGSKVKIMDSLGEHYLIESPTGISGYCMKGFIVLEQ